MKKVCLIAMVWMCLSTGALAEPLQMTLDYYPPFEYEENGEPKGIGTEVVKAVLKEAGMEAEFKQYPFARAYKMVTEGKKPVFYYSLVRTPERESLVQWIGIVASAEQTLLAKKDKDIRIEKLEDVKNYSVGTIIDDVVDQYLLKNQEKFGLKIDRASEYEQNIHKLMKERFDLVGVNKFVTYYLLEKLGYKKDDVKVVYVLNDLKSDYYLAASKAVPAEIVTKLQAAFEKVHTTGIYQKIVDQYFGSPDKSSEVFKTSEVF